MSLRTVHKDRRVNTYKELVDFAEKYLGIHLYAYQKELLKCIFKYNRCKKWG